MVVSAYTLIRTRKTKLEKLVGRLEKLKFVKEVTPVYGEYNIILKTETSSLEELNSFIYDELRRIHGLAKTTTMITFRNI